MRDVAVFSANGGWLPVSCGLPILHALQFLPRSPDVARHSGNGSGNYRPCVVNRRNRGLARRNVKRGSLVKLSAQIAIRYPVEICDVFPQCVLVIHMLPIEPLH